MPILTEQIFDKSRSNQVADFMSGVVLLIDKPIGWTSFDVVNKIRGKIRHSLGIKKIKVGHAGTLDPLATGLLIVCTGKLTKEIDTLQAQDKEYSGHITLGGTTVTYDSEFPPDQSYPFDHITEQSLIKATSLFLGKISQIPPIYSAIKINGQTAYSLARKGKEVAMKAREVSIFRFDVTNTAMPEIAFDVKCSKGTYIRSLAHDYGKALHSGAYLSSLRRESIGSYSVQEAFSMDDIVCFIENNCALNNQNE
jgi:tRNA pseudouridine55 synthase